MKKSTSSQPQTLKTTLGIISLLIAAMTFNGCEKMDDMYPEQLSGGKPESETQINKLIPDTKLSEPQISATDKINPVSQDIINRLAEINPSAQDISSEIIPDSENRPNYSGHSTTDTSTTITVYPRD